MNALLNLIIIVAIFYFSFKLHFIAGILATIVLIAIGYISNYPTIMHSRANAEFVNGNIDKAMELYKKAYKSNHRKYKVDISYAQALLKIGKPQEALDVLNNILGLRITNELRRPAKLIRCMVYYKLGKLDEAYEEALELFEDGYTTSNMYSVVGLLMLEKGEPIEKTTEFCRKAYDYDSDNRDNIDNLLACYIKTKNINEAMPLVEELVENHPTFVEGWYHAAQVYVIANELDKAKAALAKIDDCTRTYMTTISEEEIRQLSEQIN